MGFTKRKLTSITIASAQFFISDLKFLLYVEMPVNILYVYGYTAFNKTLNACNGLILQALAKNLFKQFQIN